MGNALPVIIFSHGNGQSLHAYGPLADHWAAYGFVVIQPTHLDSRTLGLAPDDPRRPHLWRFREEDLAAVLDGLGSGLIAHSQKMTVAARVMADMNVWAHRS